MSTMPPLRLSCKESACNARDLGSVPGLGRPPGEGKGYPLQCSGLENSMDCVVRRVAKSLIQLSDFHFHYEYREVSTVLITNFLLTVSSVFTLSKEIIDLM